MTYVGTEAQRGDLAFPGPYGEIRHQAELETGFPKPQDKGMSLSLQTLCDPSGPPSILHFLGPSFPHHYSGILSTIRWEFGPGEGCWEHMSCMEGPPKGPAVPHSHGCTF